MVMGLSLKILCDVCDSKHNTNLRDLRVFVIQTHNDLCDLCVFVVQP